MLRWLMVVGLSLGMFTSVGMAQEKAPEKPPEKEAEKAPASSGLPHYVRVSAEIKGIVHVTKEGIQVRVLLFGSCLIVSYAIWELHFDKNDELRKQTEQLNGKTIILTGEPLGVIGTVIREPGGPAFEGFSKTPPSKFQGILVKSIKEFPAK